MVEEWKTVIIDGEVFENYEVSSYGNVRNAKTGRVLKPSRTQDGYLQVVLCKNGKRKTSRVHRLVAFAFIPNDDIENKYEVNHLNEIRDDNRLENLEWISHEENNNYGTHNEHIAKSRCKKVIGKSLTENKVIILHSAKQGEKYGFKSSAITSCCKHKIKQHHGYTWHYVD